MGLNDYFINKLESGDTLFGIDQEPYLDHSIKSGPRFITAPPSREQVVCQERAFAVCPEHPEENFQYISESLYVVGVAFFSLQVIAAALAIGWIAWNRKTRVVRASQPEFLALVAVGCLTLASAIIPLSIEGGYRFERDAITRKETDIPNKDIAEVDAACMAVPWLICVGFVLT